MKPGRKPTILPSGIVEAVTTALLYKECTDRARHGEFGVTEENGQSVQGLPDHPPGANRDGEPSVTASGPLPTRPPRGDRGALGVKRGSLEQRSTQTLDQEQELRVRALDLDLDLEQERSVERRYHGNQKKSNSLRSLAESYGISRHQVEKLAKMVSEIRPEHVLAAKTALPGLLTLVAAKHGLNALKYSDSDPKLAVNSTFGAKLAVEAMRGTSQGPVAPGVQILNYINTLQPQPMRAIVETPALEPGTSVAGEADPPLSPPPAPLLCSVISPGEEPLKPDSACSSAPHCVDSPSDSPQSHAAPFPDTPPEPP